MRALTLLLLLFGNTLQTVLFINNNFGLFSNVINILINIDCLLCRFLLILQFYFIIEIIVIVDISS
jgi:hypothetical protein